MTTITVCDTCNFSSDQKLLDGKSGGEMLAEHVEALASEGIEVRRQSCLMGCDRHCNIAIQGEGKLSYVMGKFEPNAEAAQAIVDYANAYSESDSGQVPYKQWPQGVKGHFVARIPPLG